MSTTPPLTPPPTVTAYTTASTIPGVVVQVVQTLQQLQGEKLPTPATMPPALAATAEILGQDPELRRPLGPAGTAVAVAWNQATAAGRRFDVIGNGQVALAGAALAVPPAVRITDGLGRPVPGINVTFGVTGGGGILAVTAATTDASGVASAGGWTLGPALGINSAEATWGGAGGPVAKFLAVGVGPRYFVHQGDGQSAARGTKVAVDPAIRVTDAVGNAVQGINVTYAVTLGGGSVGNTSATTDALGVASAGNWTLGTTAGANKLEARVGGSTVVSFNAQGT